MLTNCELYKNAKHQFQSTTATASDGGNGWVTSPTSLSFGHFCPGETAFRVVETWSSTSKELETNDSGQRQSEESDRKFCTRARLKRECSSQQLKTTTFGKRGPCRRRKALPLVLPPPWGEGITSWQLKEQQLAKVPAARDNTAAPGVTHRNETALHEQG